MPLLSSPDSFPAYSLYVIRATWVSFRHLPEARVSQPLLLSKTVTLHVPCLVQVPMQEFMPDSKPSHDNFPYKFTYKEGWDMVGSRHKHSGQFVGVDKLPFRYAVVSYVFW